MADTVHTIVDEIPEEIPISPPSTDALTTDVETVEVCTEVSEASDQPEAPVQVDDIQIQVAEAKVESGEAFELPSEFVEVEKMALEDSLNGNFISQMTHLYAA